MYINDTLVVSRYSSEHRKDSCNGRVLNHCFYIFDIKEGKPIDYNAWNGFLSTKGSSYVDIFNFTNDSVDWYNSNWFYSDLKDTLNSGCIQSFTFSSEYYLYPANFEYRKTLLALGPIKTNRDLIRKDKVFVTKRGEK